MAFSGSFKVDVYRFYIGKLKFHCSLNIQTMFNVKNGLVLTQSAVEKSK